MTDVDVQTLEADAGGDEAVEFSGLDLGVQEAVAQGRQINRFGLAGGNDAVALHAGEVAPDGGGEQVAGDVFAGEAAQEGWPRICTSSRSRQIKIFLRNRQKQRKL